MAKIYNSMTELIGNTPILRLNNFNKAEGVDNIYAKLEYFNPAGSVKDRIAAAMIKKAEESGQLKPGALHDLLNSNGVIALRVK